MNKTFKKVTLGLTLLSSMLLANEVNVYSHRHYDSDKLLFEKFEKNTGIKVNVVKAKAEELVAKLKIEGENTPADLLITSDIGNLYFAKENKLLQKIDSKILDENIPHTLRDSEQQWFGLTKRARVIVYNPKKLSKSDFDDYLSLADEKFKGKILVRSSSNSYNKSLLSSIIAHHTEEKALEFTTKFVSNFARKPKGNDRDQIRAVVAGEGDLAIVNTYYLGIMANSKDEKDANIAKEVAIFFPGQNKEGTHINISGAGVTKYAKNRDNAIKLIEFLSSKEAQQIFAEANYEYPVNKEVKPQGVVASWGEFKADEISLNEVGKYNIKAVEIATKAQWN